ncbi:cytochrome P450 [Aspergillus eucalypticola CBS 122712]|uniref:Cytochrome P450 n=1 Tax=Aspergillus eucalypticola (strain CBS 122712 / IBT 29274) TaxID=1448314 RepID=A0A317VFB4_ASPEC|nr:cytochrome P450 [Aspergillus eucalypticola CBS 122712]PWY72575.1 cytochrome P450 [Aspergillus eucalypticola CBS 122712]
MILQHALTICYEHLPVIITTAILLLLTSQAFYEVFVNPLKKFPGPKLAAASRIPQLYHTFKGDLLEWVTGLHAIYGNVVRVAPDELSYATGEAWKGIYGHATAGKKVTEKDTRFYGPSFNGAPDIIRAKGPDHSRFRRNFSHAFSDRALRDQQPLICGYVDMLVASLNDTLRADPKAKVNLVRMLNLTTFDIMGDLTFGDSLELLAGTGDMNWVEAVFISMKTNALRRLARYWPLVTPIVQQIIPKKLRQQSMAHYRSSQARVDKRIESDHDMHKADIWGTVMHQKEELRLSRMEMYANSQVFMVAGTETTATALSGLFYQLLQNPDKLEKLLNEIRENFQKDSDIEMRALEQMKYLNACLEEALRVYPPVPVGLPRVTPDDGLMVCGEYIPGQVALSVNQWATYHSAKNFKRPDDFIPERWISSDFDSDNKASFQPFSFGPRNCLGRNLAYHEMRVILAKLLFHFEFSLLPESVGWQKQKTFFLWEKHDLMVQLQPRH